MNDYIVRFFCYCFKNEQKITNDAEMLLQMIDAIDSDDDFSEDDFAGYISDGRFHNYKFVYYTYFR